MFTNLVVGVDGRPGGRDALRLAHQLADRNAHITLVHVYGDTEGPPGSGAALLDDQRTGGLKLLGRERQRTWPNAETICVYDPSPGKALHLIARRQDADLLVVGSCHHGAVGRVLLGDDTRAAFNGVSCALAIAPRGYGDREGGLRLIGVGYNATPESQRALTTARQLADASGATVEALWFISREDVRRRAPLPADWPDAGAILLTETQERLDQVQGVSGHAVAGGPREELARLAHRVDLLIVGSRGYGPAHSLFLGSVSSYLQRHAAGPLLILPRARTARVAASSRDEAPSPVTTETS
jgi:nucleotide-binding universal stress UspA family protein